MLGEKLSLSNVDSLRSYDVIDWIKGALERTCPMTVSCADIIIMASRDAVALVFISVSILYTIKRHDLAYNGIQMFIFG